MRVLFAIPHYFHHDPRSPAAHGSTGADASARLRALTECIAAIQQLFGRHDVSDVKAQVGGPAAVAADRLGASAYAAGRSVGFRGEPDLHTAAHEATHTVQQAKGGDPDRGCRRPR